MTTTEAQAVIDSLDRGDDGPLNELVARARAALDRASDAERDRFERNACRVMLLDPRYRWRGFTELRALRAPLHAQRHRRTPGAKPVRRRGSRRVGAGSRAGPDDEGELPGDIAAPLPVGGWR